ncbi:MAG: TetR/AcrR family transcriptional regulator [Ancalomicrobiaceae bacterium]|nr:TetR/AcrR family transcriptional regulator [Ancalomicrobiaceae bacterium]
MADDVSEPAAADAAVPRRHSKGPQRSDAAHKAILEAAEAILVEAGPGGVTFEAVARRAKSGKPTLYRWWPTKAVLLLEIYERHKDRVIAPPNLGSLRADLTEFTRLLWAFWRETSGGPAFAALIAEAQSNVETREELVAHFADDALSPLTPIFVRAIARGELPPDSNIRTLRDAVMAVYWYRLITGRLAPEPIADLIDRLLDGLIPR